MPQHHLEGSRSTNLPRTEVQVLPDELLQIEDARAAMMLYQRNKKDWERRMKDQGKLKEKQKKRKPKKKSKKEEGAAMEHAATT